MKRFTKDLVKQSILNTEKQLSIPVHDSDAQELLKVLKAPVQRTHRETRLSPDYLSKLSLKFENLNTQIENDISKRHGSLSDALSTPTLMNITELIHLNAKTKRPAHAQQAFDTLLEMGLTPDLVCMNHLMHAYESVHDFDNVSRIFDEIVKSSKPDLVSYSIMMNELVFLKRVDQAFELYEKMKADGIQPNQIVLGTLIKGCLATKQIDRAWKTFDFLRELETPDAHSFNMMIGACALTQDCEKALDMFQEMADRGLTVNHNTYNALIKACGSRPDYYNDAFELLEQMVHEGFVCDHETYKILFDIIGSNGDIDRARKVWNDFAPRVTADDLKPKEYDEDGFYKDYFRPNAFIMMNMMKLFKNVLLRRTNDTPTKTTQSTQTSDSDLDFIDIDIPEPETKVKHDIAPSLLPLLESNDNSRSAIEKEANILWDVTQSMVESGTFKMTGALLQARLSGLCEYHDPSAFERALSFFDTEFPKYGIEPLGYAFKSLIRCAMSRKSNIETGIMIWERFLEWDQKLELKMLDECKSNPLSVSEKEVTRLQQGRSSRLILDCFLIVARGFCRSGNMDLAIKQLEDARAFRSPYYLPPINLKEVPNILTEAQRQADMGNLTYLSRLKEACPPVHQNHLYQVQQVLKRKYVSPTWWGWEVMGISEQEKHRMIRKQQLESRKIQQRTDHRHAKARSHQDNKAKKVVVFKGFAE